VFIAAFYAMIGSFYYVFYKSDFEARSAHSMFGERKYRKLLRKNKFDEKKIEFLENYCSTLREQLGILTGEVDNFQREAKQ
jgi:hypothetical protein